MILGVHLLTPLGRPSWLLFLLWESVVLFRIAWAVTCALAGIAIVLYVWRRGFPRIPRGAALLVMTLVSIPMIGVSHLVVEDEMEDLTLGVKEARWDQDGGEYWLTFLAREHMARAGERGRVRLRITLDLVLRTEFDGDRHKVFGPHTRPVSPGATLGHRPGSRRVTLLETLQVPFELDAGEPAVWIFPTVRATPINRRGEAVGPEVSVRNPILHVSGTDREQGSKPAEHPVPGLSN